MKKYIFAYHAGITNGIFEYNGISEEEAINEFWDAMGSMYECYDIIVDLLSMDIK